jgi:drug/metabolite transporter (DMT)-like permease
VPLTALLLALASAVIHAGWNLLIADEPDKQAASAVAIAIGVVVFAPAALISWELEARVLPFVAVSAALEVLYLALLAATYSRAEVAFVYPIARGAAPVLVLIVGALLLGHALSTAGALGVGTVACGIFLVRGATAPADTWNLALAMAVAGCIAAYTLVDKEALAVARPLPYLEAVFATVALIYIAGVVHSRGGGAVVASFNRRVAFAGIGMVGAYGLALAALATSPAAAVAAVRESSVLIAVAALAWTGRESVSVARGFGAALIFAGVATIALW